MNRKQYFFVIIFVLETQPEMLRGYSYRLLLYRLLYIQESLQQAQVISGILGIEPGSIECKANSLLELQYRWLISLLLFYYFYNIEGYSESMPSSGVNTGEYNFCKIKRKMRK